MSASSRMGLFSRKCCLLRNFLIILKNALISKLVQDFSQFKIYKQIRVTPIQKYDVFDSNVLFILQTVCSLSRLKTPFLEKISSHMKNIEKDYKICAHIPSKIFSKIFDKVLQSVTKHRIGGRVVYSAPFIFYEKKLLPYF